MLSLISKKGFAMINVENNSKFDNVVILNFGHGHTAERITNKVRDKHKLVNIVNINLKNKDFYNKKLELEKLNGITNKSKIYIIGHGSAEDSSISSDYNTELTIEDLITQISKIKSLYNKDKSLNKQDNQKLQISIVACEIGKMEKGGRGGFAVKLSKALDKSQVSADISAYTVSIHRTKAINKNNTNYSVTDKKLGDKIRINTQNGKTEITLIEKNRKIKSLSNEELNEWLDHPAFWNICENDANGLLKKASHGSWLVRNSISKNTVLFCRKKRNKKIENLDIKTKGLTIQTIEAIFGTKKMIKKEKEEKPQTLRPTKPSSLISLTESQIREWKDHPALLKLKEQKKSDFINSAPKEKWYVASKNGELILYVKKGPNKVVSHNIQQSNLTVEQAESIYQTTNIYDINYCYPTEIIELKNLNKKDFLIRDINEEEAIRNLEKEERGSSIVRSIGNEVYLSLKKNNGSIIHIPEKEWGNSNLKINKNKILSVHQIQSW
jgi:hypothetical protein